MDDGCQRSETSREYLVKTNRETFNSVIRMHGLAVDKNTGRLQSKDGTGYGTCTNTEYHQPDGGVLVYTDISNISYVPRYRQLEVKLTNDEKVTVQGEQGYVITDDALVIRKTPKTPHALAEVFYEFYPDAGEKIFYDVLRERIMIDTSIIDYVDPLIGTHAVLPLDDVLFDLLMDDLEEKLHAGNFQGTPPTPDTVTRFLNTHIATHKRNEFREWVQSLEWDGKPRVRGWLRDAFGARAPPLAELGEKLENKYLEEVSQAWLLGAIARNFPVYDANGDVVSSVKHEVVPVIIGDQNIGKGSILRMTAGKDDWYRETSRGVHDIPKFLEDTVGRIIVELSEAVQFKNSDADDFKAFVSMPEDQVRKPYARMPGVYPRHFILAVTTNYNAVFVDQTGNRRFFPLYCDPANSKFRFNPDRSKGQKEVEQLWAEAYQMFKDGRRWVIDSDVADLAAVMQEYSTIDNPYISQINDFLDNPYGEYCQKGARVSRQIIMKNVFGLEPTDAVRKELEEAWKLWSTSTRVWARLPSTTRIGGEIARGFVRKIGPGEVRITGKLGQDRGAWNEEEWAPMLEEIMRNRARKCGCKDIGEPFRIEGIPSFLVVMLRDAGYIYEDTKDGVTVIRSGVVISDLGE